MNRSIESARRSPRTAISLPAECQNPWGQIARVMLSDISAEGCRITANALPLFLETRVVIRTPSLLGASGTVRWVDGTSAGIAFDRPLPAGIRTYLARNHADGASLIIPNGHVSKGVQSAGPSRPPWQ